MDDQPTNNWRDAFEPNRKGGGFAASLRPDPASTPPHGMGRAATAAPQQPRGEEPPIDDGLDLDMAEYKPWVLQRGRSRPVMMLHLRRYEPKSGLWMGWQIAYPHLVAVEYIGDKMLSLDFGQRQFVIEGTGLDELARHLQSGSVLMVQEYAPKVWAERPDGAMVARITKMEGE
jgi:hypothetical protein